ncbi:hypothetical protein [Magnetospirillum aberrantis]|uniref:Uncharacterized protein n=1 Tax=Magnetospirillum aberrantis SpK TaxID=908842 RepID=A0A7C9QTV2_9PROT|nr:hypothetical protein [Magnetospirillum aberrantis]NFV80177.1 hypothetical protein [Magnetospirillum aberrantis SpK]
MVVVSLSVVINRFLVGVVIVERGKSKLDNELLLLENKLSELGDLRFLLLFPLILTAFFSAMYLIAIFNEGFNMDDIVFFSPFIVTGVLYLLVDAKFSFFREEAIKLERRKQKEWLSSEAGIAWQKKQKRAEAEKARKEEWERTRPRSCARDGHEWRLSHQGVDKKWPRQHYKCFRCGATKVDEN